MKNKLLPLTASLVLAVFSIVYAKGDKEAIDLTTIKNEIAALKQLKLKKLDKLEQIETRRWNSRYNHNEEMKLLDSRSKSYESEYASKARELNRKQEDILLLKNALDDFQDKMEQAQSQFDGFKIQVNQEIENISDKIPTDFPLNIAERTASLSLARQHLEQKPSKIADALSALLSDQLQRIEITSDQTLTTRAVLFSDGIERTVWNIRIGTIVMVDIDKTSDVYQTLMRSGAVQGQRYMWKNAVDEKYQDRILALTTAIQNNTKISIPFDVLQNGKIGINAESVETATASARLKSWFDKGGLIMYPLLLCAFIALLISMERFWTLSRHHYTYTKFYRKLIPLINAGKWQEVSSYCAKGCTGLTRAIQEILKRRQGGREQAEQNVKQILLAEVPSLEKRLSIISALGATAPLLGLLGTVSGMITLFKVITETGTNDARILAGGISEALVTTQTGLIIAIPILLIHGYLSERLEDILSHYNETILEVFNIVFNKDLPGE